MSLLNVIFEELPCELDNDDFKLLAKWSTGKWLFEVGTQKFTIHIFKGKIVEIQEGEDVTGTEFILCGPSEEWNKLLSGEIKFPQALNYYHGRLSLRGNCVTAANNMRPLSYIIKKMQELVLRHGGSFHVSAH